MALRLVRTRLSSLPIRGVPFPVLSRAYTVHPNPAPGSPSSPPPTSQPELGRLERYSPRLAALSERTGTPLPTLALSFLILHELTAIIPVVGLYYLLHALGAGAAVVAWLAGLGDEEGWGSTVRGWYDEGRVRAEKVGRRYGVLGFEKGGESGAAGAVADAVGAYVLVKALLPLRIGISIAAAPAFARGALNPVMRVWGRLRGK